MQWFRRKPSAAIRTAVTSKLGATTRRPTALLMPLEPRIMFDGAIAATVEAAPVDPVHVGSNVVAVEVDIATVCGVELLADPPAVATQAHATGKIGAADFFGRNALPSAAPAATGRNVVFVDARVEDADSLLANLAPNTEVVRLEIGRAHV